VRLRKPERPGRQPQLARTVYLALALAVFAAVLGGIGPGGVAHADPPPAQRTLVRLTVKPDPGNQPVELDAGEFRGVGPGDHPAVLLAHGFGGSQEDMVSMAQRLAAVGYNVVTWSARGFGRSGGHIHLNDPRYEVDDVHRLVDLVDTLPGAAHSAPHDPVVAIAGVSYGGALALMAAAADQRIDAAIPIDTWNDLSTAFFPNTVAAGPRSTDRPEEPPGSLYPGGPYKQQWVSRFLGSVQTRPPTDPCGRMDRGMCNLFLGDTARTGKASDLVLNTLRAHSPAPTLAQITVPTFVIQGVSDSLFGLDQADATIRILTRQGTPVTVRWTTVGHDVDPTASSRPTGATGSASVDTTELTKTVIDWLDHQLRPQLGTPAQPTFVYPGYPAGQSETVAQLSASGYPGLSGQQLETVGTADAAPGVVASPPGGEPASISAIPGAPARLPVYPLAALPGQSWSVDTRPLQHRLEVVGSPVIHLSLASTAADLTVFVSLWQLGPDGKTASQPRALVSPVRLSGHGSVDDVAVPLPPSTYTMAAGSSWRVLVTSTDSGYANRRDAALYTVGLGRAGLTVPVLPAVTQLGGGQRPFWADRESIGVALGIVVVLVGILGWAVWWRRRDRALPSRPELRDVPLVVTGLSKTYSDGHRAVDDVSLRAESGQVVGLLGPNGAGKTTTMRMLMGLIQPTAHSAQPTSRLRRKRAGGAGSIYVLGEPIVAGAPVLTKVGALIDGPGFLPHLTGRANLAAYWSATGRAADQAHVQEVLEIAALGDAVDRQVRTYSHGMKQRLGIAQAMLGLPVLLILDEPTNGLDPPQIAAMRPILREYAKTGRSVLISSHLLSEVELTCTHVVVMSAGRVITAGAVADLLASDDSTEVDLGPGARPAGVAESLRAVRGITEVRVVDDRSLVVRGTLPRGDIVAAVVATGAPVEAVSAHRHLEEVFLGVIADDAIAPGGSPVATGDGTAGHSQRGESQTGDPASLVEQLRRIRPR